MNTPTQFPAKVTSSVIADAQIEPVLSNSPGIRPGLLVLPTKVTHTQAVSCLNMLLTAEQAENPGQTTVIVDATQLTRFDSSVLAVLIECQREALRNGKRFTVQRMPTRLVELARLYGVANLLLDGNDKSA